MKRKAIIVFLLIWQMIFGSATAVWAAAQPYTEKMTDTAGHLRTLTPQVGSIGGEWLVLGLARSDNYSDKEKSDYTATAVQYVQAIGSNRLHARKATDNARVIIALSAVGKDARDVGGFDLTEPLNDAAYAAKQGVNGVIWSLIALDTCGYPCKQGVREQLLAAVLSAQKADGGWGMGDISSPDMTGMALLSLAPYRFYDERILAAVESGVGLLISMQEKSGGYDSYDELNPESCAQVITALSALGIDACTDERFRMGENTLMDSLLRFSVPNGFAHTMGTDYNQMATEQAFYAMTACFRLQNRRLPLFDMRDVASYSVADVDGDGAEGINDATVLQRFLAEYDVTLSAPQQRFADSDNDGAVTISDVTLLQRRLAQ